MNEEIENTKGNENNEPLRTAVVAIIGRPLFETGAALFIYSFFISKI